jgi:hypothetical protein
MPDLVSTIDGLIENIDRYWREAQDHPELIADASKVRQWKCVIGDDGRWICGPSRFVGYKDMTPQTYLALKKDKDGGLDGTETEHHLRQWTDPAAPGSKIHGELIHALGSKLAKSQVALNRAAAFSTVRATRILQKSHEDREQETIEALLVLSRSLTEDGRRALVRRLEIE